MIILRTTSLVLIDSCKKLPNQSRLDSNSVVRNAPAPREKKSIIEVNNDVEEKTTDPILNIQFDTSGTDSNTLGIALAYSVPDIGITEMLEITI